MTVRTVPAYRIGHLSLPALPSDFDLVTNAMARSNPFKTIVGIPQFAYELREIPDLLRSYGQSIIRGFARGHLTYEFGIKPLVSDLVGMHRLIEASKRRATFWRRLQIDGQASSAITLQTDTAYESSLVDCHTDDGYFSINCPSSRVTYRVVRAYVLWKTTANFPEVPDEITNLFARAVTGQTLDLVNLWNVLPWSWLVDWFSDVGNLMEANKGFFYVNPSGIRLMAHVKTTRSIPRYTNIPDGMGTPYTSLYETKERWSPNMSSSQPASLPIFDGRQGAIASSLLASRARWSRLLY
jgi:hypothetical protein